MITYTRGHDDQTYSRVREKAIQGVHEMPMMRDGAGERGKILHMCTEMVLA